MKAIKAWAINTGEPNGWYIGHGWFNWLDNAPHVHGCRIALFATRREARCAILGPKAVYRKARVVRVTVTIEESA